MRTAADRARRGSSLGIQSAQTAQLLHESFLTAQRYRFLKIGGSIVAAALVIYAFDNGYGSGYGGSWAGYTLGTAAALLVFWLTWFGYQKRNYAGMQGQLATRLSAHVYLGLSLFFLGTLHTGFHFGPNIHTLTYALMCLAIASGAIGVFCYVWYPRLITENRAGMPIQQMLRRIASLDDELRVGAMPLDARTAAIIARAADRTAIGGSAWQQLRGRIADCETAAAIAYFDERSGAVLPEHEAAWRRSRVLLDEKALLLARVRQDLRYKAIVDGWLYLHVPISFMLIAAILAHVLSVFFVW